MITLEKLTEIEAVCSRIREVQKALQAVYDTYKSPRFDSVKTTSPVKDPVTEAVYKAERMSQELDELLQIRMDFETELESINDPEICAIIRQHYILGKGWKQTSMRVYGIQNYFTARDRLRWFLAPHHEPKENT